MDVTNKSKDKWYKVDTILNFAIANDTALAYRKNLNIIRTIFLNQK